MPREVGKRIRDHIEQQIRLRNLFDRRHVCIHGFEINKRKLEEALGFTLTDREWEWARTRTSSKLKFT